MQILNTKEVAEIQKLSKSRLGKKKSEARKAFEKLNIGEGFVTTVKKAQSLRCVASSMGRSMTVTRLASNSVLVSRNS